MNLQKQLQIEDTLFSLDSLYSHKFNFFKNETDLGKLYQAIPWNAISTKFVLPQNKRGPSKSLNAQGMVALMILKHYTCLSDEKLLHRLNTDYAMQYFCGIELKNGKRIKDNSYVSNIRTFISQHFDLDEIQSLFVKHWKAEIQEQDTITIDATCYESYVRYPTDVKLLQESISFLFEKQIIPICKSLKIRTPSLVKYEALKKYYLTFSKKRRKTKRAVRKLMAKQLPILSRGLKSLEALKSKDERVVSKVDNSKIMNIEKVLIQQSAHYDKPKEPIKDRIVSLAKPYVRPIVRGKENKPVEFGVKVNKIQVGGISIIQRVSFDAFNECTELEKCVGKSETLLAKVKKLGADQIFATNANRTYVTSEKIVTNFARKGPKVANDPDSADRKKLGILRSTSLEGSFGNEKNHYGLTKIKAKSEGSELVWLYFGIMTSNVVKISEQRAQKLQKEKQKLFKPPKVA